MELPHQQIAQVALAGKLIYLAIPKNGNSFVRRVMNQIEMRAFSVGKELCYTDSESTYDFDKQFLFTVAQLPGGIRASISEETWVLFTIIRNPYERVMSCFYDKSTNPNAAGTRAQLPSRAWRDFPSFIEELGRKDRLMLDGHWMPQRYQFGGLFPYISHFIDLASLDSDLPNLLTKVYGRAAVFHTFPDSHATAQKREPLSRELASRETVETINALYADDFASLGYETL